MSDIENAQARRQPIAYAHTVNSLIRKYREMTGLSQQQLADLSTELLESGTEGLDRDFTQSAIARWERDPRDGGSARMRVEKLREDTIRALAIVLQHAMLLNGFEAIRVSEIEKQLSIANNRRADPKEVDSFALEVTAIMTVWPRWLRDLAQNTIREVLKGMDAIYLREREKNKARQADTTQSRDSGSK
jgi:transcriptional regulator with XRE-family HTH domain